MEYTKEQRIKMLLEAYFEGATTLAQERELRSFFTGGERVPAGLEYAREMFGFFCEASQSGFSASADRATPTELESRADHEAFTQTQPCTTPSIAGSSASAKLRRRPKLFAWSMSTAAALVLGVVLYPVVSDELSRSGPELFAPGTYCYVNGQAVTNFEDAYAYSTDMLGIITESLHKPAEYLEEPARDLTLTLEALQYLSLVGDAAEGAQEI